MNERIQELADLAEDYADGIVDAGGEFHPAYTRKLAELIVQEVCWDMMNSHVDKTKINRVAKSWGVDVGVKE